MTLQKVRVGLIDSGIGDWQKTNEHMSCRFVADNSGGCHGAAAVADRLGHGSTTAEIILYHVPDVMLYNAQVFDGRGVTSAVVVSAAIDWLVDENVDMINLSLGLQQDRDILRKACEKAISQDIIMIASSPAQGAAVFPAAYPGIIRATGDARCRGGEISYLDSPQADFGGCPRRMKDMSDDPPKMGGASMGCAHISGHVASYLAAGGDKEKIRQWLVRQAKYIHSERRTE